MKRKKLEKALSELGCKFLRHGGEHDIWVSSSGKKFSVPRHPDINELLAKSIIKKAGRE